MALPSHEAKQLVALCAAGRLYEVQDWIRAGKSLTVPAEIKRTPLRVALDTGFDSLIELLLRHETNQQAKNDALRHALLHDQRAIAELAVAYGADNRSNVEVCRCGSR